MPETTYVELQPPDPVIVRDGRPFGAGGGGNRLRSLDWPLPSTCAGCIRTAIGKGRNSLFGPNEIGDLLKVEVAGPLPTSAGELFFPAAKDIVFYSNSANEVTSQTLRPKMSAGFSRVMGNSDLLVPEIDDQRKPLRTPAFWSHPRMIRWLCEDNSSSANEIRKEEDFSVEKGFLCLPEKDNRMHVSLSDSTLAAEEGLLFSTSGLDLNLRKSGNPGGVSALSLSVRVRAVDVELNNGIVSFGGERRIAFLRLNQVSDRQWSLPEGVAQVVARTKRLRLVLATPAIFEEGWKPGWLKSGNLPGCDARLKLVGAIVDRWKPVSGFGMDKATYGPKAIRRMVTAGSVFFFEVEGDASEIVTKYWLRPVSDKPQDCADGFGLALWGKW